MKIQVAVAAAVILIAGGAMAALSCAQSSKKSASEKLGFRLSLQCWTRNKGTLYEAIDFAQSVGIRYLEVFPGQKVKAGADWKVGPGLSDEAIAEIRKKAADAGIKITNYGVTAAERDHFEFAARMGIETLAAEPEPNPDKMKAIDALCKEFKVKCAIHNHPKPSTYWNPDVVLRGIKGCSSMMGACADTGHWYRSGLTPLECLRKLKGKIISLHFKDLDKGKTDVPFGTGECDVAAMLKELKKQGFKGVFSIEYEKWDAEQDENVRKCVENVEKTCAEIARGR